MEKRRAHGTMQLLGPSPMSFAQMYDAHVDAVYRYIHRRCRDHSLAEDITQETFLKAIRSTDDPSTVTIGWLLTVARNGLFDVLRRQMRYEKKLQLIGVDDGAGRESDVAERIRVERALSQLRVEYRLVLTLHYINGFTVPAMAEQLDRTVKSVEGLVTRARRELAALLDEGPDATERGARHD